MIMKNKVKKPVKQKLSGTQKPGIKKLKKKLLDKSKSKKLITEKDVIMIKQNPEPVKKIKKEAEIIQTSEKVAKGVKKSALKKRRHESERGDENDQTPEKKVKSSDKDKTVQTPEEPKKSVKWDDEEVQERTLFVGNVPVETKSKDIQKLFSRFGNILSVRSRNIIPADPKMSKKVAGKTGKIHHQVKTVNFFVVFSSKDEVIKALQMNGITFKEHHLRVDRAKPLENNQRNSIFIGNLPFDVQEEDVWKCFEECGNILSVRVVRDNATGVGKGFGFVNFDHLDAVELALQLEATIGKREIRVKRIGSLDRKKTPKGKKLRKKPRTEANKTEKKSKHKDEDSAKRINFHGRKFKTKKPKKINKGDLQKKKISQILTKS